MHAAMSVAIGGFIFFFFSSRRRHTRCSRDWSSDVCSSDLFRDRGQPHFVEHTPPDHGRIETRKIWTTTELNSYLDFPHVGQAFVIERHRTDKKSGKRSEEHTSELQSRLHLVCRLLLEKKKT